MCEKLHFRFFFFEDEKYLVDYPSIKDGTKLNLIVKKIVDGDGEQDTTLLREATYKFLRNFYPESTSLKIVEEFIKVKNQSIIFFNPIRANLKQKYVCIV